MNSQTCSRDDILLFWSGELSPGKMRNVERHLDGCMDCSRFFTELSDVQDMMNELPLLSPKRNLVVLPEPEPGIFPWRKFLKARPAAWITAAAAVVALLVLIPGFPDRHPHKPNLITEEGTLSIQRGLLNIRNRLALSRKKDTAGQHLVVVPLPSTDKSLLMIRKRITIMKLYNQKKPALDS